MQPNESKSNRFYPINVGVLGHVDSGKTTLVAALSTQLSTAALDKHPQSKERGITLDLGFSSFITPLPPGHEGLNADALQITLVDCPGHASLVRTIIGGAQIIDMMLLVIDVTKGIQAQTAECLIVGELTTDKMVVVLNKIDLLPEGSREKLTAKAAKMLLKTFAFTKFKAPPIVALSAKSEDEARGEAISKLTQKILELVPDVPRQISGAFLMSVDHCFAIKGHGTVMTGTVLQGSVRVNDMVEIPHLREQRKVRSMQIFKKPQRSCSQGDRVGICVTQLDPERMERGWLCQPGSIQTFSAAIALVEKIKFFVGEVRSKQKLHITIGHSTVMADVDFFGLPDDSGGAHAKIQGGGLDMNHEYWYQDMLYGHEGRPYHQKVADGQDTFHHGHQWCLLRFATPVTAPQNALVIGSRLDSESTGQSCRLAMHGRLIKFIDSNEGEELGALKVYKLKQRHGFIDRVLPDGRTAICKGLFKRDSDISAFIGMKVVTPANCSGTLLDKFGTVGKFKVQFAVRLPTLTSANRSIMLEFKKHALCKANKKMVQ